MLRKVHGINSEDVHFHEIGAIDSLVDIIGVCAALNYLNPEKVYCNEPMLGKGFVQTEHGKLSVTTCCNRASKKNLKVLSSFDLIEGNFLLQLVLHYLLIWLIINNPLLNILLALTE